DFKLSGAALLTTVKVAEAIAQDGSLDNLTRDWTPSPQLLRGVRIERRVPLEDMPGLQAKMAEVSSETSAIFACNPGMSSSGTRRSMRTPRSSCGDGVQSRVRLSSEPSWAIASATFTVVSNAAPESLKS